MMVNVKAILRSAALSDLYKEHIELSVTHISYSIRVCSRATVAPSGAWEQMCSSAGEVKHDFYVWTTDFPVCGVQQAHREGSHRGVRTIGGQGPPNAKHVHCCDSFKKHSPSPKGPIESRALDFIRSNHSGWKFRFSVSSSRLYIWRYPYSAQAKQKYRPRMGRFLSSLLAEIMDWSLSPCSTHIAS